MSPFCFYVLIKSVFCEVDKLIWGTHYEYNKAKENCKLFIIHFVFYTILDFSFPCHKLVLWYYLFILLNCVFKTGMFGTRIIEENKWLNKPQIYIMEMLIGNEIRAWVLYTIDYTYSWFNSSKLSPQLECNFISFV